MTGHGFRTIELDSTTSTPSTAGLFFQQLATMLDAKVTQAELLKQKCVLNSCQAQVVSDYFRAPEKLLFYLLYGSAGSGKTRAMFILLLLLCLEFPGIHGLVLRRTYSEIEDAIIPKLLEFLDIYDIKYRYIGKPVYMIELPNGSDIRIRSAVKSLNTAQGSADSLGGTEYHVICCDEGNMLDKQYFLTLISRMRSRHLIANKPIIMVTCNPPSEDHWLYKFFFSGEDAENTVENHKRTFHFPVTANILYVGKQYIDDMIAEYAGSPSQYKKFVAGEFGPNIKGDAVFSGIFNYDLHAAKEPLIWNPALVMVRGWDFGFRRPVCHILQDDTTHNEIKVFRTVVGNQTLLQDFAKRIQRYCEQTYPGARWRDFCDPAGDQRKSTGDKDVDILRQMGMHPEFRRSEVTYGLNTLATVMTELSDFGRPVLQICPDNATLLIDALMKGYTTDPRIEGDDKFRPFKDGFYDNIVDALRYPVIHLRPDAYKAKRKQFGRDVDWLQLRDVGRRGHRRGTYGVQVLTEQRSSYRGHRMGGISFGRKGD